MKTIKKILWLVAIAVVVCVGYLFSHRSYTYSNEQAVAYAREHAHARSKNLCALYVRRSIEAGGCPTFFFPGAAANYVDFLPKLGFKEIESGEKRQPGDIVVFEAVKGHPFGHIAIWDGSHWISDFHQKGIIVNMAYTKVKPRFYRLEDGKHRRKLLTNL